MISALVTTQLEKYPQMKAQDIIKLIYQNEFGGGHMIDDPETSLKRLKDEAKQLKNNIREHVPYFIQNGDTNIPLQYSKAN